MKTIGIFVVLGWLARITVLLAVVFIGFGAIAFLVNDDTPPDVDKAAYAIQTFSTDGLRVPARIYFTNAVFPDGELPVIKDYWWFDGEKYHYIKGEKTFTEPVEIVKRSKSEF